MPTPACLATAVIGAPGSATNTARAESRIRWSLRAASAWRPLIGPGRLAPARAFVSVMKKSVANTGTNYSVLLEYGTEDFVPLARAAGRTERPGLHPLALGHHHRAVGGGGVRRLRHRRHRDGQARPPGAARRAGRRGGRAARDL